MTALIAASIRELAPRVAVRNSKHGDDPDGSRDVGGMHEERHPADRLDDQRLALQWLPGEEEQVERIPQTDPADDEEDSVAEQVLPELGDVRLKEPRGEQQPDDKQDRPAAQ